MSRYNCCQMLRLKICSYPEFSCIKVHHSLNEKSNTKVMDLLVTDDGEDGT